MATKSKPKPINKKEVPSMEGLTWITDEKGKEYHIQKSVTTRNFIALITDVIDGIQKYESIRLSLSQINTLLNGGRVDDQRGRTFKRSKVGG